MPNLTTDPSLAHSYKIENPNTHRDGSSSRATLLNKIQLQQLEAEGFTSSLAASLDEVKKNFPLRIWVIDNSSSMRTSDGHQVIHSSSSNVRMKPCTRWQEISSCVEYHMRLASLIEAPTRFRLLNSPKDRGIPTHFSIAEEDSYTSQSARQIELDDALANFRRVLPSGGTPLTKHIDAIRFKMLQMAPALQCTGQRVCITLATDGLPSDDYGKATANERHKFVEALRSLEGLPVWVVIRLCTDDDNVVSFWNDIDSILELDIDVLDDFTAEAKEIAEFNPWLNYTLPLHRLREFGNHDRLYDLIDERPFTKSEVRDFCASLFGEMDGVPDPNLDWKGFLLHVSRMAEKERKAWNPIQRRPKKWVSTNKLRRRSRFLLCG